MPATGFLLPTARTVDAGSGTFTNDANITADDGAEVTFSLTSKNTAGRWLRGQTFNFDSAIPAGNVIDLVEIRAEWRVNNAGGIANLDLQAWVGGGAVGAVRQNTAEPTTLTTNTFDITADRAWTRADLLNGTFELRTRGTNGNSTTDPSYRWDYLAVQVTHSPPPNNPVHQSHGLLAVTGSLTTAAVPVPSGVAADDVIVVQLNKENFAAITPPAGFTQKSQVATSTYEHTVFWKRATGNDTGTYDFTWTGATFAGGSAHRISNCHTSGDPFTGFDHEFSNTGATNTPAVQIADTAAADVLLLWLANGHGGTSTWTQPTDFTEVFQGANQTAAWKAQAVAGDTGALTGSSANTDSKAAFLGALQPPQAVSALPTLVRTPPRSRPLRRRFR